MTQTEGLINTGAVYAAVGVTVTLTPQAVEDRTCSWTHVCLAGGRADVSTDVEAPDEAVALHRVNSGSKRQRGPILR